MLSYGFYFKCIGSNDSGIFCLGISLGEDSRVGLVKEERMDIDE